MLGKPVAANELTAEIVRNAWDVIVIGAGPGGALAARQIALAGMQTLLVDAKQFPRDKVCGGYLNGRALAALRQTRLAHAAQDVDQLPVTELELIRGRQVARFPLPAGRVICRTRFDAAVVGAATDAGVTFVAGAPASLEPTMESDWRRVTVVQNGRQVALHARVVICADGLSRTSVRQLPEFATLAAANSRVGIGAVVESDSEICPAGQIKMVLSRRGYVGVSRIGPRRFNIAAAVDRESLLRTTPAKRVASILNGAGIEIPPSLATANWRGTPPLTSQPRQVASHRVLIIGDAAGYIEPFTGEGMASALESAIAIAPLAVRANQKWNPAIAGEWESLHRRIVSERQRTCKQLAWILRRPWAAFAAVSLCRAVPGIATRMIANTSSPAKYYRPAGIHTL